MGLGKSEIRLLCRGQENLVTRKDQMDGRKLAAIPNVLTKKTLSNYKIPRPRPDSDFLEEVDEDTHERTVKLYD